MFQWAVHWLLTGATLVGALWLAHERIARQAAWLGHLATGLFGLHLVLGFPLGTVVALRGGKALWSGPRIALWALNAAIWASIF